MTPEEKQKLNDFFDERYKHEVAFLKENESEVNEHGVFIYQSSNSFHSIRLDAFLRSYRDWLIEHNIVKPIEP